MSRRRPTLEEVLGILPRAEDGADRLVRDLRAARSEQARDDVPGDEASAGTRDPGTFTEAVVARLEEKRLGWAEVFPDGDDAA